MRITTILLSLYCIASTLALNSCNSSTSNSSSTNESEQTLIEMTGVERLKQEAANYNTYSAQTLSDQNPMPNVRQQVDETGKMYVFEYIWNENIGDINSLNHEAGMRNVVIEMSNNPQSLNFMKLLVEEGYGIRFTVEGCNTHTTVSNEISSSDIADMIGLAE